MAMVPRSKTTRPASQNQRLYDLLRKKYIDLVQNYNRLVERYSRSINLVKRIHRNYLKLWRSHQMLRKLSTKAVQNLVDQIGKEKFGLVIDENHKVLRVTSRFLEEIEMSADAFQGSFYLDILFERYLPPPPRGKQKAPVPAFDFPFLLSSQQSNETNMHPFAHFRLSGSVALHKVRGLYIYYLRAEDVSSTIELEYFQKTDETIRKLSVSNLKLHEAHKTIEMHKRMLISLTCSLIGEYSKETSSHLSTMQVLTEYLSAECKRLGMINIKNYDLDEFIRDVNHTSVLHDIGKMAIPATILNKPGPLNPEERAIISKHPEIGASYIQKIMDEFAHDPAYPSYAGFLQIPWDICMFHHESWDGSGYPKGLKGNDIPIAARIISITDTYDAMRGNRPYVKRPKTHEEAMDVLKSEAGRQFDPQIVLACCNIESKFKALYKNQ
jgi:HD-GYP domain-containing protein (c-di-GMP phosphodiesterase class II)